MRVPWRALPGFQLAALIREIAAYYEVAPRSLRRTDRTHRSVAEARDALFFELIRQRRWSAEHAGRKLGCTRQAAAQAAQRHATAIAEWRDAHSIPAERKP